MADIKTGIFIRGWLKERTKRIVYFPNSFPDGVVPLNPVPTPDNHMKSVTYYIVTDTGAEYQVVETISEYSEALPSSRDSKVVKEYEVKLKIYSDKKGNPRCDLVLVRNNGGINVRFNEEIF